MAKRGPDAQGVVTQSRCWFAHRRLSIIDTSNLSNQPMVRGDYSITFNGEIYNFRELREDLKRKGRTFQTEGDTEVLLIGLIEEGVDFLKKVNGFFAFGFYQASTNQLILGRDRFGIKPLCYCLTEQEVVFGSSLGTITPFLDRRNIDLDSLSLYLSFSYIPFPKTILEGVNKLEPGIAMIINKEESKKVEYYKINNLPRSSDSFKTAKKKVAELLSTSVERRMVADVPVGTFLSGGVDSSIITLLASQQKSNIPAFSIGFPDQPYFDESEKARKTAKYLGIEHHTINVTENDLEQHLEEILDSLDEPFADSSGILVNLLSRFARTKVKVVLSGDGADELFGGYNKHRALLRSLDTGISNDILKLGSGLFQNLPSSRNHQLFNQLRKVKRYSNGLKLSFKERYLEWARFTRQEEVSKLLNCRFNSPHSTQLGFVIEDLKENEFNSVLAADFSLVLPNDMLTKVDIMSMHNSLETRVPFLDHELVDYVFSLPASYKLSLKSGKSILKAAFSEKFPSGFFDSSKKGFEAPLTVWFKGPLKTKIDKLFSKEIIEEQNLFNYGRIQSLIKKVNSHSPGDTPHTVWALLLFQHWYYRFISGENQLN